MVAAVKTTDARPTWGASVAAFLASDPAVRECIRQAMQESASYERARAAHEAGVPALIVREMLIQALVEKLLC